MKQVRIGLIFGGPSLEHDVSVSSAKQVESYLSREKFDIVKIKISRTGKWPKGLDQTVLKSKIDFAFIAMHGQYGEDGLVQALLETSGVPYSGSGVMASSLAMDKFRSSLIAKAIGIMTPKTWMVNQQLGVNELPDNLVLKPNNGGSSQGVMLLSKAQFVKNFQNFVSKHANYLLQERIEGREITASVLGDSALPLIEIKPKQKFYDYKSKYEPGQSEHVVNPALPNSAKDRIQTAALDIHNALGCRAMSRSDFILQGSKAYYLETNTIPGLTKTSLLPEAAKATGLSFPNLLERIIEYSK